MLAEDERGVGSGRGLLAPPSGGGAASEEPVGVRSRGRRDSCCLSVGGRPRRGGPGRGGDRCVFVRSDLERARRCGGSPRAAPPAGGRGGGGGGGREGGRGGGAVWRGGEGGGRGGGGARGRGGVSGTRRGDGAGALTGARGVRARPRRRTPRARPLLRLIQPAFDRARTQMTRCCVRRRRVQRPPHLPPLLPSQPGPQHLRRPTRRRPQRLPVVDRAPLHLARVPPQRRPLRGRPATAMTPVPLHPHRLPSVQEPRPAPVVAPRARLRLATVRTPPPLPHGPTRQRPQPLEKGPPALDDVHGLCDRGLEECSSLWSQSPSVLSPHPTRFANTIRNRVVPATTPHSTTITRYTTACIEPSLRFVESQHPDDTAPVGSFALALRCFLLAPPHLPETSLDCRPYADASQGV